MGQIIITRVSPTDENVVKLEPNPTIMDGPNPCRPTTLLLTIGVNCCYKL